ncbi:hypothetical protein Tco_0593809 [Tanacetum coccineum]
MLLSHHLPNNESDIADKQWVPISKRNMRNSMYNKPQRIKSSDGAKCLKLKNTTSSGPHDIFYESANLQSAVWDNHVHPLIYWLYSLSLG